MKKDDFFENVKELLELDEVVDENTTINLDSIAILSLIAFIDENFDKQINADEFKSIKCTKDLMNVIGKENING